jgi:hypothetical protein
VLKKVTYPKFVLAGIKANHRGTPVSENLRLFAADTETENGNPHYLTATDGDDLLARYVNGKNVFSTFRDFIFPKCRHRGVNVCYFHVLNFDTLVLLFEKRRAIYEQGSEYSFSYKGCKIEGLHGKINSMTIHYRDKTLKILDSYAFTSASLENSLQMFKVPAEKLPKPKGLGKTRFDLLPANHPDRIYFEKYSVNDTTALHKLATKIVAFHREYDVRLSISLPQFAARVFRHHFFKRGETIPFPPLDCARAAELSYHGGKNRGDDDLPRIVEDAYEIDISSAFPYAMSLLPQMVKGAYMKTKRFLKKAPGVYLVSGEDRGRYPLIYNHAFKHVRRFKKTWITGHELSRALVSKDITIEIHEGWVWLADAKYKHNALRDYVLHFYGLKEKTSKDDPNYSFFKLCLNGGYGKFAQAVAIELREWLEDPDASTESVGVDYRWDEAVGDYVKISREHKAGGLYNPFIATQITGHTRAYLYDLENKYGSFHSATDAIKTTSRVKPSPGLGGLKIETYGRCYAFRNKLYLHYAKTNNYCGHNLNAKPEKFWMKHRDRDGQHLCKYGLHGFKGSLDDLVAARHDLIAGRPLEYTYNHMIRLREGLKRKEAVCSMVPRREVLDLKRKREIILA